MEGITGRLAVHTLPLIYNNNKIWRIYGYYMYNGEIHLLTSQCVFPGTLTLLPIIVYF